MKGLLGPGARRFFVGSKKALLQTLLPQTSKLLPAANSSPWDVNPACVKISAFPITVTRSEKSANMLKAVAAIGGAATLVAVLNTALSLEADERVQYITDSEREKVHTHVSQPFLDLKAAIENKEISIDHEIRDRFHEIISKAEKNLGTEYQMMLHVLKKANRIAQKLFPETGATATKNIADWLSGDSGKVHLSADTLLRVIRTQYGKNGETSAHRARLNEFNIPGKIGANAPQLTRGTLASMVALQFLIVTHQTAPPDQIRFFAGF
jgi:hypothetical protein